MINKTGDTCVHCQKYVDAGTGRLTRLGRHLRGVHAKCDDILKASAAEGRTDHPLSRVAPVAWELRSLLEDACVRVQIAGSIRRGSPRVGDIELVVIPKVEEVEEDCDLFGTPKLKSYNLLWRALDGFVESYIRGEDAEKSRSFWWVIRREGLDVGRVQVDVFTATLENWGLIYTLRTGPGDWSRRLVIDLAKRRRPCHGGYVRNADGVPISSTSGGMPTWTDKAKDAMPIIPTPEEKDVFAVAGIPWVPIHERRGELAR